MSRGNKHHFYFSPFESVASECAGLCCLPPGEGQGRNSHFVCTGALAKVQVFGKWHSVPRKQATYGDAGLTYTFSGLTLTPKPWIPVLERVRDQVCRVTGQTFNFVLVNR